MRKKKKRFADDLFRIEWCVPSNCSGRLMKPIRITLFALLVAVATVQSGAATQDETIPIIDVHTHTAFTGDTESTTGMPRTEEQYFKEWREAGVVGAVAHTSENGQNFHDLKSRNVTYCGGVGDVVDTKRIEDGLKS